MSQHDLTIDNQGFPAFRADLNNALQALGSTNSGTTAPTTPFANQLWYDTTNNILKIRNQDNDAWISIATLDQSGDLVASFTATNITATTALIADTINEKTSATGVTIDGVLLKDGEINAVGVVKALGTSSGGGELRAYEDTDNGTNFVSLKSPATLAANRTFVLPSSDGSSGQALTTDGSGNLSFSSSSGKLLQVVSTTKTDTTSFASANTNTFVDITDMSVTITPTTTNSKMFVMYTACVSQSTGATIHIRLLRDSTSIGQGNVSGDRFGDSAIWRPNASQYNFDIGPVSNSFLDTTRPASTSAITYKLQATLGVTYSGTFYLNRSWDDSNNDYSGRTASTITVMEIAA